MKVRASRTYSASANNYFISKEYDCTVIPVKGMCFIDSGLTESGVIEPVEIIEVTIEPESNSYHGEFKHEVRQFQKPYDNQQAEQISLMV
ncbi:hypothetical protein [Acinetobacter pittii]|uniref:hypothetical protein n=1 Tax=Acinetobacter pittii TaxID=48296 RepID=UPI00374FD283